MCGHARSPYKMQNTRTKECIDFQPNFICVQCSLLDTDALRRFRCFSTAFVCTLHHFLRTFQHTSPFQGIASAHCMPSVTQFSMEIMLDIIYEIMFRYYHDHGVS
eukprot:771579_1